MLDFLLLMEEMQVLQVADSGRFFDESSFR